MDEHTGVIDRLHQLATVARGLGADIDAVDQEIRSTGDTPQRRAGFRLDTSASFARSVAAQLEITASDLTRIAARGPDTCQVQWGVCPEHGNTLRSSGGRCWCSRCSRSFDYDRAGMACEEPAAFLLRDGQGRESHVCTAHAADASERLIGAHLTPLPGPARETSETP
ncbi:hypothetical protein ABZV93_04620 [Actinopolymorpha sp. NPDC004070]|uniref:hypothetical protein n=1 Tax=Actinopolymorpha sp. NPDC004070 TaxID=3154548 RepID=UPI0033AA0FF6